jgi:CubicO group peptidase (beta-lactamase class C family)
VLIRRVLIWMRLSASRMGVKPLPADRSAVIPGAFARPPTNCRCRLSNVADLTGKAMFALSRRAALVGVLPVVFAARSVAARGQASKDSSIARVENGLLPRAVPKAQVGKRSSIVERMKYHGIPAMSLAVIEDGHIAWARAYGVRDRDNKVPVTTETLFQAASLSKPVSALGALALVQAQRVDLAGDVRQWLRSWTPDQGVTLRQLLSHTAGLTVSGFAGYVPGMPLPTTVQILNGEKPANNGPVRAAASPGTKVSYSGGGYVAVQQLIMDVTQSPYDEYMQRSVLSPLTMTHSGFEQPLPSDRARLAAWGHRRDGSTLEGNWMIQPELAPAGLWTTPSDLAQVIIELQDALAGRPSRLLTQASAREMLTARVDNAGFGVFLTGPNGASRRFIHSGRNAGFDAMLVGYKKGRQGAVVMINRNNNEGFIEEVLESVAREYKWPDYITWTSQLEYEPVPAAIQATYAGTYEAAGRPSLIVVFEDKKLFARSGEDPWFRLYPVSENGFVAIDNEARWTFASGPDGRVSEVVVRLGGNELRRRRVP